MLGSWDEYVDRGTPKSRGSAIEGIHGGHDKATARYLLDLETEGLRTTKHFRELGIKPRTKHDALRISQFGLGVETEPGKFRYLYGGTDQGRLPSFTDIVGKELLARHNIQDHENLPKSLLDEITRHQMGGYWDVGVYQEGNVLREGLKRHVKAVLGGEETRTETEYIEGMLDRMLQDIHQGKRVQVAGWNIGFDWGRIMERAAGNEAVSRKLHQLMISQNFRLEEAAQPIFKIAFDYMKQNADFAPRYTDDRMLEGIIARGEDAAGAIVEHRSLRDFMDIIAMEQPQDRFQQFQGRFRKKAMEIGRSEKMADELARLMTGVEEYSDFERVIAAMKGPNERYNALASLFDASFKPTSGKHVSLLGISGRDRDVVTTGFNFMLGWRQEQVAEALAEIAERPEDRKYLRDMLERGAHDAAIDIGLTSRISRILREMAHGPNNSEMVHKFVQRTLADDSALAAGFLERHNMVRELKNTISESQRPKTIKSLAAGAKEATDSLFGHTSGPWWVRAGMVAAGLYLISDINKQDEENRIEGIRMPETHWDSVEGIRTSGQPMSDFGSGRNPLSQLTGIFYGPQVEWVPASALGKRGDALYLALSDNYEKAESDEAPSSREESLLLGEYYHGIVAHALGDYVQAEEYPVYDPELKIQGRVDVLLRSGIPLEIKTLETAEDVENLKQARPHHISQANFYAYALTQPYSYIMYAARDDPRVHKVFRIPVDRSRLMDDYYASQQLLGDMESRGMNRPRKPWSGFFEEQVQSWEFQRDREPVDHVPRLMPGVAPQPVNSIPALMQIGDFSHLARRALNTVGHGGYVQGLGRAAKKSHIQDKYIRVSGVNPAMRPFVRRGAAPHAVGSRAEAAAC